MPRKRTVQPEPLESFTIKLDDGSIAEVEIRDETCNIIGRGLHKRDKHQALCDRILEYVAGIYLSADEPLPAGSIACVQRRVPVLVPG